MKDIILYPLSIFISIFEHIGKYFDLMFKTLRSFRTWHLYLDSIPDHIFSLGIASLPIVIFTGLFSGMVTAVQAAYQFESGLIPTWYVGGIVGEAVLLELGPMITGLVMTGRVGATIAAELGTMRVSEQIDALETLSFDPVSFLVMPRIVACAIMFPVMIIFADLFGIIGGYLAALSFMDVSSFDFIRGLKSWFRPWSAIFGLIKGFFFGLTITSIACYFGFYTKGGAQGVGKSTTTTVVVSCLSLVVLDYILAALLL